MFTFELILSAHESVGRTWSACPKGPCVGTHLPGRACQAVQQELYRLT